MARDGDGGGRVEAEVADATRVKLSSADRILYPEDGITKGDGAQKPRTLRPS